MLRKRLVLTSLCVLAACSSTVESSGLADRSVTNAKLANASVDARTLSAGAVGTEQLANGAVDGRTLAGGAVGTQQLAAKAVTNATLEDGAVDARVIAPGAVGTSQLGVGVVSAANLAPSAAVLGFNGLTGAVTLEAGSNLSLAASGHTFTLGLSGPIDAATVGGLAPSTLFQLSGSQTVTGAPTFSAAGAPFAVTSSQVVPNLNADLLNGVHATGFARRLHNVLTVGPGGEDFGTIQAAIDSISDASPTSRYLIEVAPGTYAERVVMKSYVDLRGSGSRLTTLSPPPVSGEAVTVEMADDTELRDVNVIGAGFDLPVGVRVASGAVSLRDVRILTSGGSGSNCAIRSTTSGTITLDHVQATGIGSQAYGLLSNSGGAVIGRDAELHGTSAAIYVGGPIRFISSELDGFIFPSGACLNSYRADFTPLSATCQ